MKHFITLWSLLAYLALFSQIPVTDVATNASIGISNSHLMNINTQLQAVNNNLSRLIKLMEKNNKEASKSSDILKEELEAKKRAPNYVTLSTDVNLAIDLKSKILEAYRTSKQSIEKLEFLTKEETDEFIVYAAEALQETGSLIKQCGEILQTKAIIMPEERLKMVSGINQKLEVILENLIAYNHKLSQVSSLRKARRTMIYLNINQP
ncbi:hypothetical protein HCG49_15030 [Arenibacter sp. 6A1]|uniref:hypothetical protein n=1 Tax=Arenibacter sp. 6A1 TaxID=2720391 RepID=UPI0014466C95|nr:hypothetical protein [Arenibacter sp. 6A1]NKI27875.1 hypothetical protein [Arenibacter sp. 6A1]